MPHTKNIVNANDTSNRELVLSRLLNAPINLVWEVFTKPEHIKHWWGPTGFTNTIHKMEVKPNGKWDFIMHGPDGTDYENKVVFAEVIKPERIVFDHVVAPNHRTTITFAEQGDKTFLTFKMVFETAEVKEKVVSQFKAAEGLTQNIDRLETYLKTKKTIKERTLTRIFNAPREVVFNAWADPKLLPQWWGPKGFTNPVCEFDVKNGGNIYIEMKAPDGQVYPMDGNFTEVINPERIVFNCGALDKNGKRMFYIVNTIIFEEEGNKTRLTVHASVSNAKPEAKQHLDGMNEGWSQSLVRLEELIARLN